MQSGRMANNGATSLRMGRRCLTTYEQSDSPGHVCVQVPLQLIRRLNMGALGCTYGCAPRMTKGGSRGAWAAISISENKDKWEMFFHSLHNKSRKDKYNRARLLRQKICDQVLHKVFGEHSLDNAYAEIDLGSHHHGINGATVSDILHTLQAGTIPRLVKTIIGVMTDSQKSVIDSLVEELFSGGNNRSSERMLFPRVSFTRGFSSLTLLNAEGKTGQLFVIAALLQLKRGREVLSIRFAPDFDSKRENHARKGQKNKERKRDIDEEDEWENEVDDTVPVDVACERSEGSSVCSDPGGGKWTVGSPT